MATNKLIEEFRKNNPEFPEYIIEEVESLIPDKTKDSDITKILINLKEEYENSLITPNEAIGVITAQSVGAEATQMTLNTFHFAGVASHSVEGLPRIIEILDGKKNLEGPMMKLYPKAGLDEAKIKLLADKIKETKLVEFATSSDIDIEEKIIKIDLNLKALKKLNVEIDSIIPFIDKKIRKASEIQASSLLIKGTPTSSLKDLIGMKELAFSSIVYGIKGISDVTIVKEGNDYVLFTKGVAIKQLANIPELIPEKIYSNDIQEMYDNFGIEAARMTIIREITEVVKSQGLSINERHVLLIADIMTNTGEVKGMTRYGIVADKLNVLTRASFETPLKHLSRGALMNEDNQLSSITENVMTNQMVNVGTGMPKIAVKSRK